MLLPTIGIEIEVGWSAYFPQEFAKWFDNGNRTYRDFSALERNEFDRVCTKLDERMLPQLEKVSQELGLSRGKDPYWEFVFPPVFDIETTLSSIRILEQQKLLPLGIPHSLHITIADIISDTHSSKLATWLEILAGVSSKRLKQGVHSQDTSFSAGWARRGNRGMRQRPASELWLGAQQAVEFRSLLVPNTLIVIQELLIFAQRFGGVVRDIQNNIQWNADISIWQELNLVLEKALIPHDLDLHADWGNPHIEVDIWDRYGKFLDVEKDARNLRKQVDSYNLYPPSSE